MWVRSAGSYNRNVLSIREGFWKIEFNPFVQRELNDSYFMILFYFFETDRHEILRNSCEQNESMDLFCMVQKLIPA